MIASIPAYEIIDRLNAARAEDVNSISDADYNNLLNRVNGIMNTLESAANMHADVVELSSNVNMLAKSRNHRKSEGNSQGRS